MIDSGDRIADYLDGTMDADARARFEAEIRTDEALAVAVYRELGMRDALGEPPPAAPGERARPVVVTRRGRAWWRWAIPVFAAGAALIWLRPGGSPTPDVTRGGDDGVRLLSPPNATVEPPTSFSWHSVSGANVYRLEVFDAESDPVVTTIVPDTIWTPSDALPATFDGSWRVIALRDGREIDRSPLRSLRYP